MFEIFDDHDWSLSRILKISEKITRATMRTGSDNSPPREIASLREEGSESLGMTARGPTEEKLISRKGSHGPKG